MPPIFAQLLTSRRFILFVAGIVTVFFQQRMGIQIDPDQLTQILSLVAAWIVGDSIRSDLALGMTSASPLVDKLKILITSPRFIAVIAGIVVVLGNEKLHLNLDKDQVTKVLGLVIAWVVGDSFRTIPPVNPPVNPLIVVPGTPQWMTQQHNTVLLNTPPVPPTTAL